MPKRKREDDAHDTPEPNNGAKAQRVRHKLQHGTVKLGHAFKVAKGFERQKLGRRRKNAIAQSNAADVQRIDAEAAAVKTLDTSACARVYLHKILMKIKAVAESSSLPAEVRKTVTLSTDTAVLNVHARLCNSNPVKEVLPDVLKDIQQALGVKVMKDAGANKKRLRAKDHDALAIGDSKGAAHRTETGRGASNERSRDNDSEEDGGGVSNGEDASDDGLERYKNRLASSDDEDDDDDDENLDVDAIERELEREGVARKPSKAASQPEYDHKADLDISDDGAESASPSPEPRKAPAPKKSSFVPSLSMGGYISGSDSDIEDLNEAPRKNRRGQRARQQIWEKKYGAKAQHLQKQDRDKGWDPKRGATDGGGERRGKDRVRPGNSGANQEPVGMRKEGVVARRPAAEVKLKHRDDEGSLHPSWAAAKLAKEKKEAAPVAFQGKKITFD